MSDKNFVTLENVVNTVLMEIGDEDNRRYFIKASQWVIDVFRDINIGYSPFYYERKVTLDNDIYAGDYPKDLVKLLSVGVYYNGEFFPFTRRPDMALLPPDASDNMYTENESDSADIPEKGVDFGYRGANIGYWTNDPENCRFFVKNYRWNTSNSSYSDTTSDVVTKVIIRYKSDGIECQDDLCIPVEAKALIVGMVYYKFMRKNIPVRVSADEKDRQERIINTLQEKYESMMYEPHNFWEVRDSIYSSLNTTARR